MMVLFAQSGRVRVVTLSAGDISNALIIGPQLTISIHPDSAVEGGSQGVYEYSTSPLEDVRKGTARWIQWRYGPVTMPVSSTTEGRLTGLRARCLLGSCVFEVVGASGT